MSGRCVSGACYVSAAEIRSVRICLKEGMITRKAFNLMAGSDDKRAHFEVEDCEQPRRDLRQVLAENKPSPSASCELRRLLLATT